MPEQRAAHERERRHLTERQQRLRVAIAARVALPPPHRFGFVDLLPSRLLALAIGWLVFGVAIRALVFGILGASPAGPLLCPSQCATCAGPGRVIAYNFDTQGCSHKKGQMGYALVCNNPVFDVRSLTIADVERNKTDALQPYLVSGYTSFAVEGALLVPLAAIAASIAGERRARRKRAAAARRDEADLSAVEEELAAHDHAGPSPSEGG